MHQTRCCACRAFLMSAHTFKPKPCQIFDFEHHLCTQDTFQFMLDTRQHVVISHLHPLVGPTLNPWFAQVDPPQRANFNFDTLS